MGVRNDECVRINIRNRSGELTTTLRRKGLVGSTVEEAIDETEKEGHGRAYPPFKLNGRQVRRQSRKILEAGDVLDVDPGP